MARALAAESDPSAPPAPPSPEPGAPSSADETATLATLKARVKAFAEEREWLQFHTPKNLSMALAAEAAELMEHFLWSRAEDPGPLADPAKQAQVRAELADVLIYALEFANVAGIDLTQAIAEKMQVNARKYPVEKARGRAVKYTEL